MITDSDKDNKAVRQDEISACNQVLGYDIVHNFGVESNKPASQITIKELLLIHFEKKLKFNATEKGKETFQNFRCFTGIPPARSRGDEARVRNALNYMCKEINPEVERVLSIIRPDVSEGNVPAWNQKRNKIALEIQDKMIDTLCKEENEIAKINNIAPPKRSAPHITVLMGRYDKVITSRSNHSTVQLKDSMRNFLGKTATSSASATSSSSYK